VVSRFFLAYSCAAARDSHPLPIPSFRGRVRANQRIEKEQSSEAVLYADDPQGVNNPVWKHLNSGPRFGRHALSGLRSAFLENLGWGEILIVVLMGVAGAGKTTIGQLLAQQLAWEFADGDNFHPTANIEKMKSGKPLDDADRIPWIEAIHSAMTGWAFQKHDVVLACSALKRSYRLILNGPEVHFVYLRGDLELIAQRLRARHGHYATEQLLASQYAALEEPEDAIVVDVLQTPQQIVSEIRRKLHLQ